MAPPHSSTNNNTQDAKPTEFISNPNLTTKMSVHPAEAEKGPKVDSSLGGVCSRSIGKFPGSICIGFLVLFLGLSVPYKDAAEKMSGSNNNDWTVVMPPTDVFDMWSDAKRRTSMADPERKVNPRTNMASAAITYLYKWDDSVEDSSKKDIFTPESLRDMCELERYFVDDAEYASTFCPLSYKNGSDVDDGCAAQRLSAPRLFYAATFFNHTIVCPKTNPENHQEECKKMIKTIRTTIEKMLPVPTIATNPSDSQKYYVTSMPGSPTDQFNFTSFYRPDDMKDGAYQLTTNEACPLLPQWHVDAVKDWLYTTVQLKSIKLGAANMTGEQLLGFFMDKDTLDRKFTARSRSMIYMGSPLTGFKDSADGAEEQKKLYDTYMMKGEPKLFKQFNMIDTAKLSMAEQTMSTSPYRVDPKTENGIQVDWYSNAMNQNEFSRMLGGDFAMVAFSILFVWVWISVHVWSLLIGSLGMLEILLSIPVTYTIYSIWVPYYSQMHILAIFLVLGVGADDVFVMTDGWKQSVRDVIPVPGESRKERLQNRMSYAYGRTASAVFNTSFTTAMAFVSTAISPIMTISAFGTYAALAIVVNYIMVITWFPAVILTAELYIFPKLGLKWGPQDDEVWTEEVARLGPDEEMKEESVSCVDNIFEKYYAKFLLWHVKEYQIRGKKEDEKSGKCCDQCRFRPGALGCFLVILGWAIFATIQMSQLEPPTKAEAFFPADHMSTGIVDIMSEEYLGAGAASYQKGIMIFGLKSIDRTKFDRYKPDYDRGVVSFDPDFDIYPTASQKVLLDVCTLLEKKVCHVLDDPSKEYLEACSASDHTLVRGGTLNCWIREFHEWHKNEYNNVAADDNAAVSRDEFVTRLLRFRKEKKPKNEDAGNTFKNSIGVIDTGTDKLSPIKIEYVAFEFTSTMVTRKPVGIKQPLYDMMEEIVKKISADAPKGLKFCDQDFGYRGWVWMETEKALVNGLFNGLYICFPIAFAVLALATRNGPLALVATIAIGFIVASVLGFVRYFNNWDLGIAETIAGIIVIGFSVDYVVHMGHMYIEAAEKSGAMTREKRFYYAASKMGSTVMAGAVTTAGSGAFMFMCQMMFFYKMAVLITLTIGFSFVFSFGFFMAYLVMVGPEYDNGNLGSLCNQSLVEHAVQTVQETKDALAAWKKYKLETLNQDGAKENTDKDDNIELVAVTAGTDKEELSGEEILNWGSGEKGEEK